MCTYSDIWGDMIFDMQGIQQGLIELAWIFPSRTVHEKFSTGLSLKNFEQILAEKNFK
jgi:hypothetical protein